MQQQIIFGWEFRGWKLAKVVLEKKFETKDLRDPGEKTYADN